MSFQDDNLKSFVGQGIVFPIQLENGRAKVTTGFELIESGLKILLSWPKFTRYLLNEYGSNYQYLLNQPNDKILESLVREYTTDAIKNWEPRLEILEVKVIERSDYKLKTQLTYKIRKTQLQNTLVFPYYTAIPY